MVLLLALQVLTVPPGGDPFAFFQPSVTVAADDLRQLNRGEPVAQVLSGKDREVAVWAAVPINVDADRLVAWIRRIEALKKSPYILAIGRFSDPPRIDDLADLTLDDEDLSAIESCRPGQCGIKLSAEEMQALQLAAADAGADWKPRVVERFRQLVLQRVQTYLATGQMEPYEDDKGQV